MKDMQRALRIAAALQGAPDGGGPTDLSVTDRRFIGRWIVDAVNAELLRAAKPKHRPASNDTRDFFAVMDYLVNDAEKRAVVAARWGLTDSNLGRIVTRWRTECERQLETRNKPIWRSVIRAQLLMREARRK